jgi:hypothetical protein
MRESIRGEFYTDTFAGEDASLQIEANQYRHFEDVSPDQIEARESMFSKKGLMLSKASNKFTVSNPSTAKGKESITRKTGRILTEEEESKSMRTTRTKKSQFSKRQLLIATEN